MHYVDDNFLDGWKAKSGWIAKAGQPHVAGLSHLSMIGSITEDLCFECLFLIFAS
jgi:hypothetical protein